MKIYQHRLVIVFLAFAVLCMTEISSAAPKTTDDIARLDKIHVSLTEGNKMREKVVKGWLRNEDSGYPDLVRVLLQTVKCPLSGCNVKGPKLPLDVIDGWCRKNRPDANTVIMNHTANEVKEAYMMTWYERNGTERELTLEQILSGK